MPFVNNQGVKIFYTIVGQGTPIVLLHGGPGSHQEWYACNHVHTLMESYQVILIDLRGNGQSDKPHDSKSYLTKKITSDIIAVLDELKIESAHCWGYSLGGYLAFCLSRDYPERFYSYIIGGAQPKGLTKEVKEFQNSIREKMKDGADGLIAIVKEKGEEVTPEAEKGFRAMDYEAINAWMNSADLFSRVDEHLPELEEPFLFYAGEKDEWNPYPQLLETRNEMKNATAILFEDMGHEVQFIEGVVLPYVLKFLNNIEE
ncbi:MAG: alpha/beta hydrolase [Candidatus Heimdallarchaeota archaeon]|nr:alpha/beta hydrolase [Candidatus Heimdallarchaeota archaeon]MCK4770837.1 alpha/beta hydrolase [Candidatus Heimdallarchaeota archaeon]